MGFNFDFNLDSIEEYIGSNLRVFILMTVGLVLFLGIIAASVFFISVRGAEQTLVPDVQGKDLTSALLELQVKELYPRIQLRYSQTSTDKGLVLEQDPQPGVITKAGRRVQLVISNGVMLNTVENFTGRSIDDVRMDIQMAMPSIGAAASGGAPLLTIREPVIYVYSEEAVGTVLQQRPEAGAVISGATSLELVVSRGLEQTMLRVPELVGLNLENTLAYIGQAGIGFEFTLKDAGTGERAGTVVAQSYAGGTLLPSNRPNTRLAITMTRPAQVPQGEVFALFQHEMPANPYPVPIRLESISVKGERRRLLSVQFAGGKLTVPFQQPEGSTLVLYMLNREIYRQTVTR